MITHLDIGVIHRDSAVVRFFADSEFSGFVLQYNTTENFSVTERCRVEITINEMKSSSGYQYKVIGLKPNKRYYVRARATDSKEWSRVLTFKTKAHAFFV